MPVPGETVVIRWFVKPVLCLNNTVLEIPIARAPEAIWFRLGRSIPRWAT